MLITTKGNLKAGGSLYKGTCSYCKCEVLVREQEVQEIPVQEFDGETSYRRFCKCPQLLCGEEIELTYDRFVGAVEYEELVVQYGPEV